jgi:hypothetical protein
MVAYDDLEVAYHANFTLTSVSGDCTICQQHFNSTDMPAQHIGFNECRHVFGESCLTSWFDMLVENAQTPVNCPICRRYWFDLNYVEVESDEDISEDTSDRRQDAETEQLLDEEMSEAADDSDDANDTNYDEDDMPLMKRTTSFENVRDRNTANILVEMLYAELMVCSNNATDLDIRDCVERAILEADIPMSLPITDATWEKLKRTIRRMLQDSKTTEWDDDTERRWVRRMVRVLRWKFRR